MHSDLRDVKIGKVCISELTAHGMFDITERMNCNQYQLAAEVMMHMSGGYDSTGKDKQSMIRKRSEYI